QLFASLPCFNVRFGFDLRLGRRPWHSTEHRHLETRLEFVRAFEMERRYVLSRQGERFHAMANGGTGKPFPDRVAAAIRLDHHIDIGDAVKFMGIPVLAPIRGTWNAERRNAVEP